MIDLSGSPSILADARGRRIGRTLRWPVAGLVVAGSLIGCSSEGDGAPGAAVASGDVASQQAADEILSRSVDSLMYELPDPGAARPAKIDAAVPTELAAWHATVTRELISATGGSAERRLLVKIMVDYVPSNTADWGVQQSSARVARCFEVSPDPRHREGPGVISPAWRSLESACDQG